MPDPRVCQDNKSISPVIRVNGLSKSFDKVVALSDINLEVYPGEIFGLLGPNGSGKTTLLKILLGLSFPTKGEAFVLNKPCSDIGVKSQIGFLPDMPQYYPFLSPLECLDFYSSLFNLPKNERNRSQICWNKRRTR